MSEIFRVMVRDRIYHMLCGPRAPPRITCGKIGFKLKVKLLVKLALFLGAKLTKFT